MAADPIVYCLETLTDYDQFERLCHDLMALDGYRNIEPLGGNKDKGRDAIHFDPSSQAGMTIFAYSVREDWRKKLAEDCEKISNHGHTCHRLAFLCTASFTATERDSAIDDVQAEFGWTLELYGLERLRTMLTTTHRQVVAAHPQIFCPPFFAQAGGLSLAHSLDQVIIDHVDADSALAHWLARRLTLLGYRVWCRGLAPIAGTSVIETIRSLVKQRAFHYVPLLSPSSVADPNFTQRRSVAQASATERSPGFFLPVLSRPIDEHLLDHETRRVDWADFTTNWAIGLAAVEGALRVSGCPRQQSGAMDLAVRSFLPSDVLLPEPELVASNLFPVVTCPTLIWRFRAERPFDGDETAALATWGYRKLDPTSYLSFLHPPPDIAASFALVPDRKVIWRVVQEIEGIGVADLVKELLKKSLYAECRRRGLQFCTDRNLVYFPFDLLKHDHLPFRRLDGQARFFNVAGERTHGKGQHARKYRYHLGPVFVPKEDRSGGLEIIVRIRLRFTDVHGTLLPSRTANARRKSICKSWWNEEWLARTMGMMQFLAAGGDRIAIGGLNDEKIVIEALPRTWQAPVRLNEESLKDAVAIREEEEEHLRDEEVDDDD